MSENKISIIPISELLNCNFFIPSYQRGYRWTAQQVTDLLDDVWEFINKPHKKDDEWYCLQPIVVTNSNEETKTKNSLTGDWKDIIDGQQRLTTTFLILNYLDKTQKITIKFETRKESEAFLNEIDKKPEVESNTNVDFYHIYNSYKTIQSWFKTKTDEGYHSICEDFLSSLLEKVKLIWYETIDSDSIEIFTRINSGKIPLTNAELIKALFLNSSNFEKVDSEKLRLKQLKIASEWDTIEYALQDNSFWYFINKNENKLATRIEFIFNLMYEVAKAEDKEVEERKRLGIKTKEEIDERKKEHLTLSERFGNDEYSTFRFFHDKFKSENENEINHNWKEIKKHFQTLEEWYNDRELYHKIGYLIAIGTDIKGILNEKKEKSKTKFIDWLDEQIFELIGKKPIEELEYGKKDNFQLIGLLLLHNVITTLNSEDTSLRFPFDKYKDKRNGGWSLEHIHAQNSEDITKLDDFREWLKAIDDNDLTEEINQRIKEIIENEEQGEISQLVADIGNLFGDIEIHSIENMALLSRNDNSKLNNGLFPVKRERIIELEKNGAFIPIATKKVFQKYFEGSTKQLSKWEEKDRKAYLNDIKETLKIYFPQTTVAENEQ
jgi:uncharacterized protein with ParB-like and HNH nuclease domain